MKKGVGCALAVVLFVLLTALMCRGDPIDATVRLSVSAGMRRSGVGTGAVFAVSDGYAWIVTCHHVVGPTARVDVEFWANGWQAERVVSGEVVARGRSTDSAVLRVRLGEYAPPAVPLASSGPRAGDTILSVGCAKGSWPTLFRGHVTGSERFRDGSVDVVFQPIPADGRSGSAVFSADGSTIVGVLHSRAGEGGQWGTQFRPVDGRADSIDDVVADLGARTSTRLPLVAISRGQPCQYSTRETPPSEVQGFLDGWRGSTEECPDGRCPGILPGPSSSGAQPTTDGLFPQLRERFQQRREETPRPDVTLPPAASEALPWQGSTAGNPLAETNRKLDQLIGALRGQQAQPPAVIVEQPKSKAAEEEPSKLLTTIQEQSESRQTWAAIGNLIVAAIGGGAVTSFSIPLVLRFIGPVLAKIFWSRFFRQVNDDNDAESDRAVSRIGRLMNGGKPT